MEANRNSVNPNTTEEEDDADEIYSNSFFTPQDKEKNKTLKQCNKKPAEVNNGRRRCLTARQTHRFTNMFSLLLFTKSCMFSNSDPKIFLCQCFTNLGYVQRAKQEFEP